MAEKSWTVLGMMSGTSLDGLDMALVKFSRNRIGYGYELLHSYTFPYSDHWKRVLKNSYHATDGERRKIDRDFGIYLGELALDFLNNNDIEHVDLIASHGQTIFHKPEEGYTLQIGDGQMIYNKTGIPVAYDFRTQDVALGGQGAPLVPIGDRLLFSDYDFCLNLGGFANISFENKNARLAFDICAVNTVMNHYAGLLGHDYDEGGTIAASGKIDSSLLKALNALPYYRRSFPKSLGFEFVEGILFPLIDGFNLEIADILRTYVAHVTIQIARCVDDEKGKKMLITGGGALNTFLIEELKSKTAIICVVPDTDLVNFKEALIFGLLGVLRLENEVNCLRSVTGAKRDHSSGVIISD